MTGQRLLSSLLVLAALLGAAPSSNAASPKEVLVTTTRVHLGDLLPGAEATVAAVDLGPSPAVGGSRLVTRADMMAALDAKQVPPPSALPEAVRVVRKAKRLEPADVDTLVRTTMASKELGRGVTLASVHAIRPIDVPDGWTRADVDVPRAPKKAGSFSTTAVASLFAGDEVIARFAVPLDLAVSADGATFDAPRGALVTLIVRRSFVEVRIGGVAGADADVGDPVPIQLRPSGRVVRARLTTKDEAIALEGNQ
jgi:hypothetical protein